MTYDPEIHHRRSIRLKNYDYSEEGIYFITLCTQDRLCLFGNIMDGKMNVNEAGLMVTKLWHDLPDRFNLILLDEYIVMPNHLHGLI
jgi:putative transposase